MAFTDALLPEFDQEMASTRKTLERVPEDKLGWKPHSKSYSMGQLASHIVNMLGWTKVTVEEDSFDMATNPQPPEYKSRQELLESFDRNIAEARASIARATDDQLKMPWSLKRGSQVFFTHPRITLLRTFIMNHTIHHRAQLGVYLRLNDVPVPSVYGPSADEGNM